MGPIVLSILYLITFTLLLVFYLWMSAYLELRQTLGFIPGPKSHPFIGLLWQIKNVPYQDRFKWFNDLCFEYRKGMVVTWFGIEPTVNIRKPRQIEVILDTERHITKSKKYETLIPWLENGLITSTDDTWFYHRQILNSAFNSDIYEQYVTVIQEKIEILTNRIYKKLDINSESPINIFDLVSEYAFDMLCETIMGVDMDIQQKPKTTYFKALSNFYDMTTEKYLKFWIDMDFWYSKMKRKRKYLNTINILHNFTEKIIRKKQIEKKNNKINVIEGTDTAPNKHTAILDFLLDNRENNICPLTFPNIREEIDTSIFAGHQTISAAISWSLFALSNAKKIQMKVNKELKEVFNNDEPATLNQLQQLNYLDRVIKEALRLYPSVPSIGRSLENDVVIDYCFIPKGTTVNIQIYQLHHDPEVWKDPQTFDPDRFLPEKCNKRHPYSYIPFSAGPRNCIGQKFAFLVIKMVLTAVLRKWRVSSVLKPNRIKIISDFILRPYNNRIELYFIPINNT